MNLTFKNGAGGRKDEKKKRGVDKNITQVLLFPKKKKKRGHHLGPFSLLYARVFVSVLTSFHVLPLFFPKGDFLCLYLIAV